MQFPYRDAHISFFSLKGRIYYVGDSEVLKSTLHDREGIVEYALILAFVVVVAAAIANGGELSSKVSSVFTALSSSFDKKS